MAGRASSASFVVMPSINCYTPSDVIEEMRRMHHYAVMFRPSYQYPAARAPRPMPGWTAHPWPSGAVTYVHGELHRRAIADASEDTPATPVDTTSVPESSDQVTKPFARRRRPRSTGGSRPR